MSTIKRTLAQALSSIFPQSEKAIATALSVEEHNVFTAELKAEAERADQLAADLEAANTQVTALTGQLAEAKAEAATQAAASAAVTKERDQYKTHYDAAVKAGVITPGEDISSRGTANVADYNQNALDVFKRHSN